MSIPPDINSIFDIDEEMETDDIDMDLSDGDIDFILDATDGVGHTWEAIDDDKAPEGSPEAERKKTYLLPVDKYVEWINNLERAGLSYVRHDHRCSSGGIRKKNQWTERWYCHRYGKYKSVAGKNQNKKLRLAQKETKKCGCKSYIHVILSINSSTVTLHYYYKHVNHYPGHLSDLCTLRLSENIRNFVQQRAFEGLDNISIQKLLRFRAIELQDQVSYSNSEDQIQAFQNIQHYEIV